MHFSLEEQTILSGGIFLVLSVLFPLECCCLVPESCPTSLRPKHYTPSGSSVHGILRQGYWSELLFPSLGNLPDPGIKPASPAAGRFFTAEPPGKPSSRIPSLILPHSWQGGSLPGSRVEVGQALLQMPQKGPAVGLPLHSSEWSVTHSLATANGIACKLLYSVH